MYRLIPIATSLIPIKLCHDGISVVSLTLSYSHHSYHSHRTMKMHILNEGISVISI